MKAKEHELKNALYIQDYCCLLKLKWLLFSCMFVFSLHSNSQLDINIKGNMIKDMFNMAGFRIPDRYDVTTSASSSTTDLR